MIGGLSKSVVTVIAVMGSRAIFPAITGDSTQHEVTKQCSTTGTCRARDVKRDLYNLTIVIEDSQNLGHQRKRIMNKHTILAILTIVPIITNLAIITVICYCYYCCCAGCLWLACAAALRP